MVVKFQNRFYDSNQGWGLYHPDYNYWYDPKCIKIVDNTAILDISDTAYDIKKFGAGQMVSKKYYLYGTFEWEYMLPIGKNIWPAIWFTGVDSWPPEIDVMEGWTNNKAYYNKYMLFNNIFPGLFYGTADDLKHYCEKFKYTCKLLQPLNKTCRCKLVWKPNSIEVYYNNKLVSKVTDSTILKEFNKPMRMIMNNAVMNEFTYSNYADYKYYGRPFIILNFKYKELN